MTRILPRTFAALHAAIRTGIGAAAVMSLLAGIPAGPATAGEFAAQVMAPGILSEMAQGSTLDYRHIRRLPELPAGAALPGADRGLPTLAPVDGALVRLSAESGDDGPQLRLSTIEGDSARDLTSFRAGGPNPLLLFFLENVMRNMAMQTGGSPHYIRNAIRKALSQAEPEALTEGRLRIHLHPFAEDANAAKMGDYRDLSLVVIWPQDDPGRLILLKAATGDDPADYLETLELAPEE